MQKYSEMTNRHGNVSATKNSKSSIGPFVCQHILFLLALLGYDTASRLFGIGKAAVLKKLMPPCSKHQKYLTVFLLLLSLLNQLVKLLWW